MATYRGTDNDGLEGYASRFKSRPLSLRTGELSNRMVNGSSPAPVQLVGEGDCSVISDPGTRIPWRRLALAADERGVIEVHMVSRV